LESLNATLLPRARPGGTRPLLYLRAGDGEQLYVILVFQNGRRYCCGEGTCFLGPNERRFWSELRRQLRARGVEPRGPIILNAQARVERGARFINLAQIGLSETSDAASYDCGRWTEADATGD
jgi:hypothetical protein